MSHDPSLQPRHGHEPPSCPSSIRLCSGSGKSNAAGPWDGFWMCLSSVPSLAQGGGSRREELRAGPPENRWGPWRVTRGSPDFKGDTCPEGTGCSSRAQAHPGLWTPAPRARRSNPGHGAGLSIKTRQPMLLLFWARSQTRGPRQGSRRELRWTLRAGTVGLRPPLPRVGFLLSLQFRWPLAGRIQSRCNL